MFPIETNRLVLREFCEEDLAAFSAYRNDPEVAKYQSWSDYNMNDAKSFYHTQKQLAFNTDNTWFQIGISKKGSEKLIGDLAVHFFDDSNQAEIGFTLSKEAQKQGYAQEAVAKVVDILFNKYNKHRITATIDTRNNEARKLLEKLNFRREGHYIKNIFFKGEWSDEYSYALLKEDQR